MGFYKKGSSGTITGPAEFDPAEQAKKLFLGMEGLGTNEDLIIEVIASHNNEQRQQIKDTFNSTYDQDLEKELEGELSGGLGQIVLALLKDPEDYIIESINETITKKSTVIDRFVPRSLRQKMGLGTDEYAIISLLCPRTNDELFAMKVAYKKEYRNAMEKDVANDLNEDFRNLVIGLMKRSRHESDGIDPLKIMEDVEALQNASNGPSTKEEIFMDIFQRRSFDHLRAMFVAFKEHTKSKGMDIEELIEKEFSGSVQAAYLALVKIIRNEQEFYAERLKEALKGAGTDDDTLIRIIVMRSEIDLKDIMDIYEEKYSTSLIDDVAGDTSGDYKVILEKILTPDE